LRPTEPGWRFGLVWSVRNPGVTRSSVHARGTNANGLILAIDLGKYKGATKRFGATKALDEGAWNRFRVS
jgi:hypothetical protein